MHWLCCWCPTLWPHTYLLQNELWKIMFFYMLHERLQCWKTGPSRIASTRLLLSLMTQLVKLQVAGFTRQGTAHIPRANQLVAKSAGQVSYKLWVGQIAEFWMERREDHMINLFEEQTCLYNTRLQIKILLLDWHLHCHPFPLLCSHSASLSDYHTLTTHTTFVFNISSILETQL